MGLVSGILKTIIPKKKLLKSNTFMVDTSMFSIFNDAYDAKLSDVYMACANAHARHVSKISPLVYIKEEQSEDKSKRYINRILSLRPNPLSNASSFWERVANLYFQENNAFIFIEWDYSNFKEPLKALWILDPVENEIEFRIGDNNQLHVGFKLNGEFYATGIEDIIHIARNTGPNIFGERNNAIKRVLKIIETNYVGIEQAVKSSAFIRYIVQSQTLLSPDHKKQRAEEFRDAYLKPDDSTGVIYIDAAADIKQVEPKNKYAPADEMKLFEQKIYSYMGISEEILQAKASEEQFQAYYESSLAPLIEKIEQELTYKLFTDKEVSFGNRIVISSDRLKLASMKTKISVAGLMLKLPTYRPNDISRLLGFPTTENGEKEFATLNYVDANKQNEYQGVTEPKGEEDNEQDKK